MRHTTQRVTSQSDRTSVPQRVQVYRWRKDHRRLVNQLKTEVMMGASTSAAERASCMCYFSFLVWQTRSFPWSWRIRAWLRPSSHPMAVVHRTASIARPTNSPAPNVVSMSTKVAMITHLYGVIKEARRTCLLIRLRHGKSGHVTYQVPDNISTEGMTSGHRPDTRHSRNR